MYELCSRGLLWPLYSTPMLLRRLGRTALIVISAFLVVGCGSIPKVKPTSARPVDRTEHAIRFTLDLELRNTGSVEIPLDWYSYNFSIDGMGTYSGRWAAMRVIPPDSTIQVEIPAVIAISEEMKPQVGKDGSVQWSLNGKVRYQAPGLLGQILFDAGVRRPSTGFSGSGTLQMKESAQPAQPAQDA